MKYVSSFTLIQLWVSISLFANLFASLRILGCYGMLQARPSGICSRSKGTHFPTHCSSTIKRSANTKSVLEKAGGISYRQSVCKQEEINSIQKELSLLTKRQLTKERSSIAQKRLGATLIRDQNNEIFRILEDGSIYKLVQRLADSSYGDDRKRTIELARDIPVEVRVYEQAGASMAWHRDDIMYDPPQLEIVFTVENNSDCRTMWKIRANNANHEMSKPIDEIHSQETHPNSLLSLLAGGPEHCVTSLKRGRRVILKCAYIYTGANYVGDGDHHRFGKPRGKANTKKGAPKSKKRKRKTE